MVTIGKLSYSIYLWHWPLITLGKAFAVLYGRPLIYGSIAGGIADTLLAWCAYVAVEQPLRRRGPGRLKRLTVIAIGFSVTAIACFVIIFSPRPQADPTHRFAPVAFFGEEFSAGDAGRANQWLSRNIGFSDVYVPGAPSGRPLDLWRTGGIVHLYGGGPPQVVVLGTSHALMYSKVIDDLCHEMQVSVAFLTVDATSVFLDNTADFSLDSQAEAREFDQARMKWSGNGILKRYSLSTDGI